jgi:hypothetical protein
MVLSWQEAGYGRPIQPEEREIAAREGTRALKLHMDAELASVRGNSLSCWGSNSSKLEEC